MEKFMLGLALGMAGGALIVANNCKVRRLVKSSQDELLQKTERYLDEKLEQCQSGKGCGCETQRQTQGE